MFSTLQKSSKHSWYYNGSGGWDEEYWKKRNEWNDQSTERPANGSISKYNFSSISVTEPSSNNLCCHVTPEERRHNCPLDNSDIKLSIIQMFIFFRLF